MKQNTALLLALVGALLVAGSAAGPIRPVGEKPQQQPESKYVFVKLLFEGECSIERFLDKCQPGEAADHWELLLVVAFASILRLSHSQQHQQQHFVSSSTCYVCIAVCVSTTCVRRP